MDGERVIGGRGILPAAMLALSLTSAEAVAESTYTAISPGACRALPPQEETRFGRGMSVEECPAPEGYELFLVSTDTNSWLHVKRDRREGSTEEAATGQASIGQFQNVGGSEVVEWRLGPDKRPRALIFRVVALKENAPDQRVSRLFVLRLGDAICLLGSAETNEKARALADAASTCGGTGPTAPPR